MPISTSKTSTLRALGLLGASLLPSFGVAGEIALSTADNSVNIVGEFVSFADGHYTVRTELGEMRVAAAQVTCTGSDCLRVTPQINIAGADAAGMTLMPQLLAGYANAMNATADMQVEGAQTTLSVFEKDGVPIANYQLTSTSSEEAFEALRTGTAEIGMTSRKISTTEARDLSRAGAGDMLEQEHVVAVDSVVAITHPSNPVKTLSVSDLAKVYSGEITNWSSVGGPDLPVVLVSREDGSGLRDALEEGLFDGKRAAIAQDALIASDSEAALSMVNANPGALGYVSSAFDGDTQAMALVNECGMTLTPDAFSAKSEEYAFQRRLYLYNRGDTLSEDAAGFLDYATSAEADALLKEAGFTNFDIAVRAQPLDGVRARAMFNPNVQGYEMETIHKMLLSMIEHDRLSTTFRFRTGSTSLDARGAVDMERLTSYLETMPAGTNIVFVGFSDNVGSFSKNRELSEGRAAQVKDALVAFAGDRLKGVTMTHTGYGEVAPTACNTVEQGRRMNRRVEVWIEKSANS